MNGQGDLMDSLMPVIFIIGIFVAAHFFYSFNAIPINTGVLFLSEIFLTPFAWFIDSAKSGLYKIQHANPAKMDWDDCLTIISYTGKYLRWVVVPAILAMAYIGFNYGIKGMWMRRMMLRDLMENNINDFPSIAPAVKLDFLAMEQYRGPWRVADTAIKWAYDRNLVARKTNKKGRYKKIDLTGVFKNGWTLINREDRQYRIEDVELLKKQAQKHFDAQLGELMPDDPLELPGYMRGLAAAFVLYINGKPKESYALLGQLSLSYESSDDYNYDLNEVGDYYLDLSGVNAVLSNKKYMSIKSKVLDRHNDYAYTWLVALLIVARNKGGELASSRFIWLRAVDRTLWYALNQLGGRMPHVEANGIWSHMAAEEKLGMSLSPPETIRSVESLENELQKEKWIAIPKAKGGAK